MKILSSRQQIRTKLAEAAARPDATVQDVEDILRGTEFEDTIARLPRGTFADARNFTQADIGSDTPYLGCD